MSVRVTWQPSPDADIASYRLERAPSVGGPWALLVSVPHAIPGANWDADNTIFFYDDTTGTTSSYYRLIAVDLGGQQSAASTPFQAAGASYAGLPALVGVVTITVGDVATLLDLGFTTIEVWHSLDDGGTWTEVTAAAFEAASVVSPAPDSGTFRVGGQSLQVRVSGGAVTTITFDDTFLDWTTAQIVSKVNETVADLASVDAGAVRLTAPTAGRQGSLEVVSAPASLGFVSGVVYGKDARLELVDGAYIYTFYDTASLPGSRYRWRFSKNGATPISVFSKYVLPRSTAASGVALSIGTARFIDLMGKPVKAKVIVASLPTPGIRLPVQGSMIALDADEQGFVQIPLVVGLRVRVALDGTGYVRDFTVPNAPTFDLLTAASDAADPFTVQTVPPLLTRRSI